MTLSIIYILFALATASFILLLIKSILRKDYAIFGASLTRLYLSIMILIYLTVGFNHPETPPTYIHIGIGVVFLGDIFGSILRIVTLSQRQKAYKHIESKVNQRFYAAVDKSPIPFFVIDEEFGRIEYANEKLSELLGISHGAILGEKLFEILDPTCKDMIQILLAKGKISCFIKTSAGIKKVLIVGTETVNGHKTITGSIYLATGE